MTEFLDCFDNAHEIHMRLKQTIETMRAKDLPVLQDFKDMEAEFDREFTNKEQLLILKSSHYFTIISKDVILT